MKESVVFNPLSMEVLEMSNGKGDKPRPKTITHAEWVANYERIFKSKKGKKKKK